MVDPFLRLTVEKPTSWKTFINNNFSFLLAMLSNPQQKKAMTWLYFILSTFSKVHFTCQGQPILMVSKLSCDKNGRFSQSKIIAQKKQLQLLACDIHCAATLLSNDRKFPVVHEMILVVQISILQLHIKKTNFNVRELCM